MHSSIRETNENNSVRLSPAGGFIFIFCLVSVGILELPAAIQAACLQGCDGDTTFFGESALINNTGGGNTAFGGLALFENTTGYVNTAVGDAALFENTTGIANTAVGAGALESNHTGFQNTATGDSALQDNIASNNTANGYNALFFNTTGSNNTAVGSSAMGGNPDIQATGSNNTASGYFALINDTTGANNTVMGANALSGNTSGSNNIALGYFAGVSLRTESNNIDVGNAGVAGDSGFIRIGTTGTHTATFVAGIRGTPIAGAIPVGINANGQLGVRGSSARFKKDIKPIGRESEAIFALRPVSFRYREQLDPNDEQQFGLVAEEVEKIDPELVTRDTNGKPFTVRYEAVEAMLLNEFLKAHSQIETLTQALTKQRDESRVAAAEQQKEIDSLKAALKAQASLLEKVNEKLELAKPEPRVAGNQ